MRKQVRGNGLVLQAIAGTYVVTMGWDVTPAQQAGLLGFAIQRADHTENETFFMRGMKTFPNTSPPLPPTKIASGAGKLPKTSGAVPETGFTLVTPKVSAFATIR